jgi:hypothetical protein
MGKDFEPYPTRVYDYLKMKNSIPLSCRRAGVRGKTFEIFPGLPSIGNFVNEIKLNRLS